MKRDHVSALELALVLGLTGLLLAVLVSNCAVHVRMRDECLTEHKDYECESMLRGRW